MSTPAAPNRLARCTFLPLALLVAMLGALSACSGDAPIVACGVAGRQRTCMCNPSTMGVQACQLDGSWQRCTCLSSSASAGRNTGTGIVAGAPSAGRAAAAAAGARAGSGGTAGRAGRFF